MASGGSVIAIRYKGGVLMAADTLLSYGSLAKWPNIPRIKIIGKHTAICATGDYADFQDVCLDLEKETAKDSIAQDGFDKTPKELFCYLHRSMYSKRCEFEPALCQFVVIGDVNGESFIGAVDDIGTKWSTDCVATGYGAHMCIPLLRKALEVRGADLTRDEAQMVIADCLKVIFYRECRALNKFQIAVAHDGVVEISDPFSVDTNWTFEGFRFEKTAIIR